MISHDALPYPHDTPDGQYGYMKMTVAPYVPSARVPEGTRLDLVDPWLEISTRHLIWNLEQVRDRVGDTSIMAVVKCNAYGHGTVGIAQVLAAAGVDRFAVVKTAEGVALRDNGIDGEILNFGAFSAADAETIVRHGITQAVFSEAVTRLEAAASNAKKTARVHVKIDTGMSRVGIPYQSAAAFIARVGSMANVAIDGIFTTLTEEPEFDLTQIERLRQVAGAAAESGISVGTVHAESSSGVASQPGRSLDMVRPGNALYGFESLPNLDLRQTLSLKTRVTLVKQLHAGDTIGYHRVRDVEEQMLLATLPVGYADGYPPGLVDKGHVLIGGTRWPIIAYMSANHTLIDVTGSRVQENDEAVLVGSQGQETIALTELAGHTGTSPYQIATGFSPLLPRVFTT